MLPALPFRSKLGGFAAWLIYDTEAMSAKRPQGSISGNDPESKIPSFRYTSGLANQIESKWQDHWDTEGTFEAPNPAGPLAQPEKVAGREKLFLLDMFPYPSGAGLHVGHPLGYIATDVFARYKRMTGYNVLHALGYDSFGLPAEQHAIVTGIHPRINTESNIANMRRQLRRLGLGHDARRSVSTTDEEFYKWTQWIFLQIFNSWYDESQNRARPITELVDEFASGKRDTGMGAWSGLSKVEQQEAINNHRLVYLSNAPVNWCPGLGTILANEEVTAEGRSDIGNYPVFKRNMRQWTMRITKYADRLLDDLDRLDWPDAIKLMQRNWIGRSEGARVRFGSAAGPIEVFTTRPDTLFGATFMVLSPEHPLVDALTSSEQQSAVAKYREMAAALQDADRTDDSRKKTGVFIGAYATNPVNGAQIPVWSADYVLMGYGTGAIMAVPSGDERDMEFATAYNLPVIDVVDENGEYVNSSNDSVSLNGKRTKAEAISLMTAWLDKNDHGNSAITYKLRDWLFSRQRYWGEPFPIVYDENDQPISVPASALPVLLPELADFKPQALDPNDETTNPIPPLARIQDWVNVTLDLGDGPKQYRREVNVMPQWAGSCWYELRYLDPTNSEAFIDKDVEKYWMGPKHAGHTGGVDLYVGGVEHAVLHLLYARFWHKVLHDLGHVSSEEPFHRLFNQGYIQAYAYRDERGQTVPANEVEEANGVYTWQGEKVAREYGKMGKSLKNIVTPDEMYDEFGADTFRLYEMSTGPLDASRPWNTRDVVGMQRFLQRAWRNLVDEDTGTLHVSDAEAPLQLKRDLHKAIHGVGIDMQNLRFNTAISKLIELNNALTIYVNEHGSTPREVAVPIVQMLSPLCPHMAEELWSMLGQTTELTFAPFPVADPALLVSDTIEIPIQVNGKVRSKLSVVPTVTDDELRALALADEKVIALLNGAEPAKVVIVPKRLVNVVL